MLKANLDSISYKETNYFSNTVLDYLEKTKSLQSFYGLFPSISNFKEQILLKEKSSINRDVLTEVLNSQYKTINASTKTKNNIVSLSQKNTFTITTGHQLNLFTGPLYFLYKIISTINLCEELKTNYPTHNFVPIYWMATEDHDFEEIQYFNYKDRKVIWSKDSSGAVGKFSTKEIDTVLEEIKNIFGTSKNAKKLSVLFEKSYIDNNNLTDATRFLTNELFKEYGLVILDADDRKLKQIFIPYIKEDLLLQTAYKEVSKTNISFKKEYKAQVNPREINLFYMKNELRERIIIENSIYKINNTSLQFTEKEILQELDDFPERFSPNVIMRPLFQEVILPNLCYIGGGGELAYWLELKSYFEQSKVVFPMLLLRNSVLLVSEKQSRKLKKLNITNKELFLKQKGLVSKKVKEISNIAIDFSMQKQFLQKQFDELKEIASNTDKSFTGAVKAQEKKQLKGLDNLEKRLLKAEKRKLSDIVSRIENIQNILFPKQSLQERNANFSEFYIEYGENLIPILKEYLNPLDLNFAIMTL